MRRSHSQMVVVMLAAVTISVLALPVHAQTFVVNVRSWDALMADYLYMAELFGRGPNAKKELDEFVRANSGGKGVAWLDPGKPFGAYADLPDQIGTLPAYVIFLPLADESIPWTHCLPWPRTRSTAVDGVYLGAQDEPDPEVLHAPVQISMPTFPATPRSSVASSATQRPSTSALARADPLPPAFAWIEFQRNS